MNIGHLESVIYQKVCPACSTGMTREIGYKIYQCTRARCGETYDFSLLSDKMISALLAQTNGKKTGTRRSGKVRKATTGKRGKNG